MTDEPQLPPPDYDDIAKRIESGEYFQESANVYASLYLNPITDRYLFIAITLLAVLSFVFIAMGVHAMLPLNTPAPFTYISQDAINELPRMKPLLIGKEDTPDAAIKRYLLQEYVIRHETYDIDQLEINVRFIKNQSTPKVYQALERELDPSNPASPIAMYQRVGKRKINVLSSQPLPDGRMEVTYEAVVEGLAGGPQRTRMLATVAFHYKDVTVDQVTGKATPLEFQVNDFYTRRLEG